jgi:serine/threonine-protein kinase RsbW
MVRLVSRRNLNSGALQVIVYHPAQHRSSVRNNHECLAHKISRADGLERGEFVVTRQDHHQRLLDEEAKRQLWHASFPTKNGRIDFPFRKVLREQRRVLTRYHHVDVRQRVAQDLYGFWHPRQFVSEIERTLLSEVEAISPSVDELMLLIGKCGCVPDGETDVEIALREALANAIIHGNQAHPQKRVHVICHCEPEEVSIAVKDEGRGFDINKLADPTAPENIGSVHGRMKTLMDDVRFEEGGAVVRMRKSASRAAAKDAPGGTR